MSEKYIKRIKKGKGKRNKEQIKRIRNLYNNLINKLIKRDD